MLTDLAILQLLLNALGKNLTKLNTPLVEGVDVPDSTLGEGDVLVVSDQSTQGEGSDLAGKDAGGRAVAVESLMVQQLLGDLLVLQLSSGLAQHQSLRLSKEVGGKHGLVLVDIDLLVAGDDLGVVGLSGEDEVSGDELGALVDELEEGVLGVGSGLAEEDGTGLVVDESAATSDALAVRLHGQLLEIGREAVEVLVEGSNEVSLGTEEVVVPDAQETTDNGDVVLERGLLEVLVHGLSTLEELLEVVEANVQGNGETNGRPDGVTATDPVLETEHVGGVNAELDDIVLVGRQGSEVLSDVLLVLSSLEEPSLSGVGVGDGLGGSEGLGGNEEESGLGVRVLEGLSNMSTVNVRDEVKSHSRSTIGLKSLSDHDRAAT